MIKDVVVMPNGKSSYAIWDQTACVKDKYLV